MRKPKLSRVLAVLLVGFVVFVVEQPAKAVVFNVNTTVDPAPDGACDATDCTLREAVLLANANGATLDTINLLPGQDHVLVQASGGALPINSEIDIIGGAATISGGAGFADSIFAVGATGDLSLTNLTIEDGNVPDVLAEGDDVGGGLRNAGATTLTDVTFRSNTAGDIGGGVFNGDNATLNIVRGSFVDNDAQFFGGGIANANGNMSISGTAFTDNTADFGGAIDTTSSSLVTITDATFANNEARDAGAIFAGNDVTIDSSTFTGNDALGAVSSGDGGAISQKPGGGKLTVVRSTLDGNTAFHRGGAIFSSGDLEVRETLISNNLVAGETLVFADGGGVSHVNGDLLIINSTLSGNRAEDFGGGLRGDAGGSIVNSTITNNTANFNSGDAIGNGGGVTGAGASIEAQGSIIFGNFDQGGGVVQTDCGGGIITSAGGNVLAQDGTCPVGQPGDTSVDPALAALADNGGLTLTHAITPESSAHDTNDTASCGGVDQRGAPRAVEGGCDSGAFDLAECRGVVATIVGTPDADNITGTDAKDSILALGGNDVVGGGRGGDRICGGDGADQLSGEGGRDILDGGPQPVGEEDVCIGGGGKDKLPDCENKKQK